MATALLAALRSIFIKLIATMATKSLLEWLLFWAADAIVKSTKSPHDDEFVKKLKKTYSEQDS